LYANKGNIIGDWIGREGQGIQAWTTYWFRPRNTLQFGYRHAKVAGDFIPSGETLNDGSAKLDWWVRYDLSVSGFLQYERWLAPLLAPSAQMNWTTSVQVTYWPNLWK
jgi:Capsule assembly protein Wzi